MPLSTPGAPDRSRGRLHRARAAGIATLLLVGALASSVPTSFAQGVHPLEPPDRSSPRGTLETFRSSLNTA